MAASRQHQHFDLPRASLDGVDLLARPVLVVLALDDEDRHGNPRQKLLQVPLSELRIEPGPVPAPERGVDVLVVLREARAQVAALVRLSRLRDAPQPHLLGENVWSLEHKCARLPAAAGMDDRDRGAIAVTDEHRVVDTCRFQEVRQQCRLVVHVADGPR